jgi:hypothetical protein
MIYKERLELKLATCTAVKHQGESFAGLHPRALFSTSAGSVLAGIFFKIDLFHQH